MREKAVFGTTCGNVTEQQKTSGMSGRCVF